MVVRLLSRATTATTIDMTADDFLLDELASLRRSGSLRGLREIVDAAEPVVRIDGQPALMLCSNNYLGLANDERVKEAARRAVTQFGTGATGSRLISGNSEMYDALETELAEFKGTESALVFCSGYHANVGAIPAVVGQDDAIFSDELNHASIIDGARLSRAAIHVYRHKDVGHLEDFLKASRAARRKLIVTESIFSMDGDIAPLREISASARQYGALLMVDEAHGTGVAGSRGAGVVEALGLSAVVDIQMGTFSKALGSLGGYVAGRRSLRDYLLNRARSFIFTTGLPPAVLAASRETLRLVQAEPWRREQLKQNVCQLREGLRSLRFSIGPTESQIVPVLLGGERLTMAACRYLLRHGVFVQGIRPPTVPAGQARLRLTPMATHTHDQIKAALESFACLGALLNSPRRTAH